MSAVLITGCSGTGKSTIVPCLRAFGAIPIDARQPLEQVVAAILSHTRASR